MKKRNKETKHRNELKTAVGWLHDSKKTRDKNISKLCNFKRQQLNAYSSDSVILSNLGALEIWKSKSLVLFPKKKIQNKQQQQ